MKQSNKGFGLARLKEEGRIAHPEDIYIHCGCAKCEVRWQKQLKAYNEDQTRRRSANSAPNPTNLKGASK